MKLGIAGSGGIVKEVLLALQEVEEVQVKQGEWIGTAVRREKHEARCFS